MRIYIEDYFGNDMCSLNIDSFTDLCQIKNLTDCSLADVDTDASGEYIRIQLNNK
jgi:hypothetical protein